MKSVLGQFNQTVSIAPLVMFRIIFGVMLFISTTRFIANGWVYDLYITPKYYFTYYGFDWIKPLNEFGMYVVFALLLISSIGIILGYFYRFSAVLFFILFTYVELIDKTNYLNHYYFVSLVSFWLILVPAGNYFSLDTRYRKKPIYGEVPKWTIDIFKFQLGIVYFFAGVAKLNYNWLIEAQPLANWLKHQTDLPLIGSFMKYKITAYLFAWGGALYDLSIPFILLSKKFRWLGYFLVVVFHLLTSLMFPIGVFPMVMIGCTLIFFSSSFHEKCLTIIRKLLKQAPPINTLKQTKTSSFIQAFLLVYLLVQILLPFRYVLYPGQLFWNEQGFRFSWRVMLIEKAGYAEFHVKDKNNTGELVVNNSDYLTPQQEKMMATQPDMMLQYAHFLRDEYQNKYNISTPIITVNSAVSLFNQGSKPIVSPTTNLAQIERGWHHKSWILPYE